MGFALLGMIVFGVLIAAGIYWFVTSVSINPTKYSYRKDENGNDVTVEKRDDEDQ
jgi:hypothetical protein